MSSLVSWTSAIPYTTGMQTATTTIPSAISMIASVTDRGYPPAATQCTHVMYSDLWFKDSVGRTPVNDDFWPIMEVCCDGAAIEIWAFNNECAAFCGVGTGATSSAEEIYQCIAGNQLSVPYENKVECDGCSPSISVEAQGFVLASDIAGYNVTTTTRAAVAASTSASTTVKSGTAARAEVGALGMAVLGLAMLFR